MENQVYIKDDFKNLLDYQRWVNEQMPSVIATNSEDSKEVSDKNVLEMIKYDKNWYGEGTTLRELKNGISNYKDPALIDRLYEQVSEVLSLTIKNKIKAKKVEYNSYGLGVFMFERAAMGMFRNTEFYSPSKQKVIPSNEVAESNGNYTHQIDGSSVTKRLEEREDGKPKIRTINKKVFAYYPETTKIKNAVEIFISCGGPSKISAKEFLYSGIAAIIIAELLVKAKIKVKVNAVVGNSPNKNLAPPYYGCIIPVKNYDEPIDRNIIALLSSDPRFYRYDGFKGVLAITNHFSGTPFLSYGADGEQLRNLLEDSDYAVKNSKAGLRYYFGRVFSLASAIKAISDTINDISQNLNQ